MKHNKRISTALLSMILTIAMIFAVAGCGTSDEPTSEVQSTEAEATVVGEGATKFLFTVVDKDGNEEVFEIHTDKETVGEALMELELLAGEEGAYGLYVKEVNGITADYNVDQTYWAFYVNGEYANAGVDTTVIEEGVSYALKVEK